MKKYMLFSVLSVFCVSLTSCAMMDKKEDRKEGEGKKKPTETTSSGKRYS